MEVTLPNGTVITGIPEGTHRLAVMEKAISSGLATQEDFGEAGERYSPVSESKLGRLGQGVKSGVFTTGRQLGNIVGIHDDDYMREMDALNEDLMDTGMGMTGQIVGEIGATLPLGMGVGTVGKGLLLARKAGMLGKGATRALAHPAVRSGVEGATVGAVLGGPDNRAETAGIVGTLGAGFGGLGKVFGRAYGKFKLTSRTKEAKALEKETGTFIPLSQSAEPGIVKQFYEGMLANIPGVGGKIRGQYTNALEDLRRFAGEAAHPKLGNIQITADDTLPVMFKKLDEFWQGVPGKTRGAYDEIGDEIVDLSVATSLPKSVQKMLKREKYELPAGGAGEARKLLDLKNALNEMLSEVGAGSVLRRATTTPIKQSIKSIDDSLQKNLTEEMAERYALLAEPYKNYMALQSAAKAAGGKAYEFKPDQLLGAINKKAGSKGLMGEGGLQQTATNAFKALPDFPSKQGIFQTVAALGFTGAFLAGVGVPVSAGVVGAIGLGRLMVRPGFQKVISGQHNNAARLREYRKALKMAGYSSRQIASVIAAEKANAP